MHEIKEPITNRRTEWPRNPQSCTDVQSVITRPNWKQDPYAVYIGMPGYAGQTTGYFGKPWACLRNPRGWRAAYREYAIKRVTTDPEFAVAVLGLHGKTLICFCKGSARGRDADCHGDLLKDMAERLFHGLDIK